MSDMRSRVDSVRPPTRSLRSGGGLGAVVGKGDCGIEKLEEKDDATRPVFPVREVDGDAIARDVSEDALFPDDMLCAPCEDEEQAEAIPCLPDVYQPTPSAFADHRITHFPFRVWCRY